MAEWGDLVADKDGRFVQGALTREDYLKQNAQPQKRKVMYQQKARTTDGER